MAWMESVPKGFLPFLALIGVIIFVYVCQRQFRQENKTRKYFPWPILALTVVAFLLLGAYAHWRNLPGLLATTRLDVEEAKREQVANCLIALKNGDRPLAESLIMDSSLGKRLVAEAKAKERVTMAKYFQSAFQPLAFGAFGAMYSALPLLAFLPAVFSAQYRWHLQSSLEAIMPIIFPLTVAGGVLTYLIFFLYVQPSQTNSCLRISGHWFTYWMTSFWMAVVLGHLAVNQGGLGLGLGLGLGYTAVVALYQAGAIQVLITTQTYFHNSEEALGGIQMAMATILVEAAVFAVLVQHVRLSVLDRELPFDPTRLAEAIQSTAAVSRTDSFSDEGEQRAKVISAHTKATYSSKGDITVAPGQEVTVLSSREGLVEVEAEGLVPASYLDEVPYMDDSTLVKQATVTHTFVAEADTELSVCEGDMVTVMQEVDGGWCHVTIRGWVPAGCLDL